MEVCVSFQCFTQWGSMYRCIKSDNDRGFSLVELTLALGMTAIIAAFSVPMLLSALSDLQVTADAKNIATSLTYAKMSAMSEMTRCRMSLNLGSNTWSMAKYNETSGDWDTQQATQKLSDGVADSGITFKSSSTNGAPAGFATSSSSTVTFNSRGIPIEGAHIVFISNKDRHYAVTVSLSGKVQFWNYKEGRWTSQ